MVHLYSSIQICAEHHTVSDVVLSSGDVNMNKTGKVPALMDLIVRWWETDT